MFTAHHQLSPDSPAYLDWLESLPNARRHSLAQTIENQFSFEGANILFDEGLLEEANGEVRLQDEKAKTGAVVFLTVSASRDLELFSQTKTQVVSILASLPSRINSPNCHRLSRENAFVLKEDAVRIVFRKDSGQSHVTVMAIAGARMNPLGKIWRYFTQSKAEDLLRKSELYFRRADLLVADPFECRLPVKVVERRMQALESLYPGESGKFVGGFELSRESSYVCCWTMREHESYLAWKHYCQEKKKGGTMKDGGFALQTTHRRMFHHLAKLKVSHDIHCRMVGYLDHWEDDIPSPAIGAEVFWKAYWFSDEREVRLAILRPYGCWSNASDWKKPNLPRGERVPFDLSLLTDSIVFNPFASSMQHKRLRKIMSEHCPMLASRVRESSILRKPPLHKP